MSFMYIDIISIIFNYGKNITAIKFKYLINEKIAAFYYKYYIY